MYTKKSRDTTRSVRVEDVARLAGVSPITVSRTLSSPNLVREETRRKVEDAVQKTGYVVNRFASTLRSGRSSIVAVFISSLKDPEIALSMQGLADGFDGADYQLLFSQPPRSLESLDQDILSGALPFRPAGVAFSATVGSKRTRSSLVDHEIPVVEMWSEPGAAVDMAVSVSHISSGQMLGRHLGAQGYRRALFCGDASLQGSAIVTGLGLGLAESGGTLKTRAVDRSTSLLSAKSMFDAVIDAEDNFDVLVAQDDASAEGLLLRALERQYLVPEAIGIASLGTAALAASGHSPITSLRQNGYEMGLEAGRLLRNRLDGREGCKSAEVCLQLHVGRSTLRYQGGD